MKKSIIVALGLIVFSSASLASNTYAGQEAREIKALSGEEVENYLTGKGMGLAKAAELNGYPGPAHVLSLARELDLSADQQQRSEAVFKAMDRKAKELGRTLVEDERQLDRLFATKSVTPDKLEAALRKIGSLQAMLRQAHLESHLEQVAILTPGQVDAYMKLRGYTRAPNQPQDSGHRHHH